MDKTGDHEGKVGNCMNLATLPDAADLYYVAIETLDEFMGAMAALSRRPDPVNGYRDSQWEVFFDWADGEARANS